MRKLGLGLVASRWKNVTYPRVRRWSFWPRQPWGSRGFPTLGPCGSIVFGRARVQGRRADYRCRGRRFWRSGSKLSCICPWAKEKKRCTRITLHLNCILTSIGVKMKSYVFFMIVPKRRWGVEDGFLGKIEHFRDVLEISSGALYTGLHLLELVHYGQDRLHGGVFHQVHLVPHQYDGGLVGLTQRPLDEGQPVVRHGIKSILVVHGVHHGHHVGATDLHL